MRLAFIALAVVGSAATARAGEEKRPPIEPGRIAGMALAGAALGIAGAIGGVVPGAAADSTNAAIAGAAVGYSLAAFFGAYAVGAAGDRTGSVGVTIAGGLIGEGLGIGAALALAPRRPAIAATVIAVSAPLGAIVGFTLTRRYEAGHAAKVRAFAIPTQGGLRLGVAGTL